MPGAGAARIWNLAGQILPAAQIVDLYHARDLAALAARLLGIGHRDWLTARLTELDAGDIPSLLAPPAT